LPLREVLTPRREPVLVAGDLGNWQPITVKFSGDVIPRERDKAFKGAMFAAYPGDLVFSKIDARNGAIGLVPRNITKAIVTSEYPVLVPNSDRLLPGFLNYLLRADHFRAELKRMASGTSGRKRVTAESVLSMEVPVPSLAEQRALLASYLWSLLRAARLGKDAKAIENAGREAFEKALDDEQASPPPNRPVFIGRFKDMGRWSHESVLRASAPESISTHAWPLCRLGDLIQDLENGWSPKCHNHPAGKGKWGVLKLGAISFGTFNDNENKELPLNLKPRPQYEVKAGDVLISRANVIRYVGACSYVESTQPQLMICDKIFRVHFRADNRIFPRFLAEAMKLPSVRKHIEARLTGTSPTMKNISKPALLDIVLPLPDVKDQEQLVSKLDETRAIASQKQSEAVATRRAAWEAFESELFTK
jgi:type I restriction enzyme, S subunit